MRKKTYCDFFALDNDFFDFDEKFSAFEATVKCQIASEELKKI